jgi:hypothetical protein
MQRVGRLVRSQGVIPFPAEALRSNALRQVLTALVNSHVLAAVLTLL